MLPLTLAIVLVMMCARGSMAVSQFQSDASFSIVDNDLEIPATNTTIVPAFPPLLEEFNPVFGFDQPPPVLLRGEGGLDPATGIFNIVDDGYYVFIVHLSGEAFNLENTTLALTVVPFSANSTNETLSSVFDLGTGIVDTIHVAAELRSGDIVLIANPENETLFGDLDNPFIYNAFLLGHKPISSFPRVRQSAFSVFLNGNMSEAGIFMNYDNPTLDIANDFNAEEGKYVAPFKGLYVFHLSVTFVSLDSDRPAVALTVNQDERARAQVWTNSMALQLMKNTAMTIVHVMQQGDLVELVNVVPTSDTFCEATLVGYLLS